MVSGAIGYRFNGFHFYLLCDFLLFRPAQAVKVLIALAVFCTFGLQFYVCLEIVWDSIKEKCTKRPTFVNYVLR